MTQPNILLIMADQLAPQFTGTYGHPVVKTPHMDRLAARGMRFDSAYCNSPLCAPSRFSFMSGRRISNIRAYDNATEFSAAIPTFAHYLKLQGYTTCLAGKMHFVGPDQKHGFEHRITTDIYPADYAWTPDWRHPEERIDQWYHNMGVIKESGVAVATYQLDYDEEVAYAAKRQLFDYARGRKTPFCMVASFIHPHDPYIARPEFWNLYDDDEIDLPTVDIPHKDQDPLGRRIMDGIEAVKTPLTEDEVRAARRAYYANVSYFDSKVGALIQTLDEIGELDNTIVIVTADHGDMLGERGLWFKMNFFEHSARVPLIMAGPGVAHGVAQNACSLVDLMPTMIDAAGAAPEVYSHPIDGRSLMPLARGETDPVDEAIGEYCAEMTGDPVFMIRRGPYKYIHCDSDPALLFNVIDDPHELTNLVDDPDHADLATAFAREVAETWDSAALKADVLASQATRRVMNAAMVAGAGEDWDYNPPSDASQQYVRNHMDWTEAAEDYRFPRFTPQS